MSMHAIANNTGSSYLVFDSSYISKYFRIGQHSLNKQKLSRFFIKFALYLLVVLYLILNTSEIIVGIYKNIFYSIRNFTWHIVSAAYITSVITMAVMFMLYRK